MLTKNTELLNAIRAIHRALIAKIASEKSDQDRIDLAGQFKNLLSWTFETLDEIGTIRLSPSELIRLEDSLDQSRAEDSLEESFETPGSTRGDLHHALDMNGEMKRLGRRLGLCRVAVSILALLTTMIFVLWLDGRFHG